MSIDFCFPPSLTVSLMVLGCHLISSSATAQIIPDKTLGNENSVVTPNLNIRGVNSDRIDGGAIRGNHLFHSFKEFNIEAGRGVYFSNPDGISNIFSRVTGNNLSTILGRLGVLGNANLFLINPNGIVFDHQASLDVGGSFFATTADGILFQNGFEFTASHPNTPPLLTLNIPVGLNLRNPGNLTIKGPGHNYFEDPINEILIRDNRPLGLQVPLGETLAFIGGNIFIEGGNLTVDDGRIELGSVGGNSQVNLMSTHPGWRLNYDNVSGFQDIYLSQASSLDVRGEQGGTIQIQGRQIQLSEASRIESRTLGKGGQAELIVKASESIEVRDTNFNQVASSLLSISEGIGQGGNITLETPQLMIRNGAEVGTATLGLGNAGNVNIITTDFIELTGVSEDGNSAVLGAGSFLESRGNSGNIHIETGRLILRDGASIGTATEGSGRAGDVTVRASESVNLSGGSVIIAGSLGGTGEAGNITITTGQLTLRQGASIITVTQGNGNAGNITVRASETVELDGVSVDGETPSALTASALSGTGNAGDVTVETGQLIIRNGAQIRTATEDGGNAGDIRIIASESVTLEGVSSDEEHLSALFAETLIESEDSDFLNENFNFIQGNAGNIRVETRNFRLRDGGAVLASSILSRGNAGNITIIASDSVELTNELNRPFNGLGTLALLGTGNAGSIEIQTVRLIVGNNSSITAATLLSFDTAKAGNINITADAVQLAGNSGINAETFAAGNAGNVIIQTGELTLENGARISVRSQSQDSRDFSSLEFLGISELAEQLTQVLNLSEQPFGEPGSILIQASNLSLNNQTSINAASENGKGGNIAIAASEVFLRRQSEILATGNARGETLEGNIDLGSNFLVLLENSRIITDAFNPNGGSNIRIFPINRGELAIVQSENSIINAAGDLSIDNTLNLTSLEVSEAKVVDPNELIAQDLCEKAQNSQFIITGRGGIAVNPNQTLQGHNIQVGLVEPVPRRVHSQTSRQNLSPQKAQPISSLDIVPARGWIRNEQGHVILVGYDPTQTGISRPHLSQVRQCQPDKSTK